MVFSLYKLQPECVRWWEKEKKKEKKKPEMDRHANKQQYIWSIRAKNLDPH